MQLVYILMWIILMFFWVKSMIWLLSLSEASGWPVIFMTWFQGGQVEKVNSVFSFLILSVVSGYSFLLGLVLLKEENPVEELLPSLSPAVGLMVSSVFFVKFPLYFLHVWLLNFHVEANTVSSMVLASLLLKVSTYGSYRVMVLWESFSPEMLVWIFVLGSLFISWVSLFQGETKLVVACSSVLHMHLGFMGLFIEEVMSEEGLGVLSVSHGVSSFTLFYLVGNLSHNLGSRIITLSKGLFFINMGGSLLMALHLLINSGLPPSMGFWGEVSIYSSSLFSLHSLLSFILMFYFSGFLFGLYLMISLMSGKGGFSFVNQPLGLSLVLMSFTLLYTSILFL